MKSNIDIINLITEYIVKGLILFLPLFFLPGLNAEFGRQTLFFIFTALIIAVWLIAAAVNGKIRFKRTPLDFLILIFLAITGLSAILGIDKFSALFGSYGNFSGGWLVFFSCAILYFAVTDYASNEVKISGLINLLIRVFGVEMIVLILALAGGLDKLFPGLAAVFTAGLRRGDLIAQVITMSALLAGSLFYKAGIKKSGKEIWIKRTVLFFSAIALALLLFQDGGASRKLLSESRLDFSSGKAVALQAAKQSPFFGAGPGSFAYSFSKFRPADLNRSDFWQIRFSKNYSFILESIAEIGVAGILSYLFIIILFLYLIYYAIKDRAEIINNGLFAGLISAFFVLLAAEFFYSGSIILHFMFWLFFSLILAKIRESGSGLFKTVEIVLPDQNSGDNTKRLARAFLTVSFLTLAGCSLSFAFLNFRYGLAEYAYAKNPKQESDLAKAMRLNPHRAVYRIGLAKLYLKNAVQEALKQPEARDNGLIAANIDDSVKAAKSALEIAPYSVAANETLGMIYRDIKPLAANSDQWAAEFFKRAFELEPTNPVLASELGKANLNLNDIGAAEKYFLKALELKSDYFDAKFNLAKTYAKAGKESAAIDLLLELASISNEPEVYYELGRLHYNRGEAERAIGEFKRAIELAPNHSNSIYSLGLAYQLLGEKNKALFYFNKALELNPGNEEVMKRIEEVKK